MTTTWTIEDWDADEFNGGCSGTRYGVIIDPEERTVSSFSHVGSVTPANVWHGTEILIAIQAGSVGTAVRERLEANTDLLDRLAAAYRGSEWKNGNHVGVWTEDRDEVIDLLEEALSDLETYWPAEQWLNDVSRSDLAQQVAEAGGVRAWAEAEADEAEGQYALDVEDLADTAQRMLDELAANLTVFSAEVREVHEGGLQAVVEVQTDQGAVWVCAGVPGCNLGTARALDDTRKLTGVWAHGDSVDAWLPEPLRHSDPDEVLSAVWAEAIEAWETHEEEESCPTARA